MAAAWVITLPSAAVVGAVCWFVAHGLGPVVGTSLVFVILVAAAGFMFWRSRQTKISSENVNHDWQGGLVPAEEPPAPAKV